MRYTLYNSIKRVLAIILLLSSFLCLGGCDLSIYKNYREVNQLHLVQTMGLDEAPEGIRLTATTGIGTQEQPGLIVSRPGKSIVTAMAAAQEFSPKDELYFSHTRYGVIGEAGAKVFLGELLDYLERSTNLRMDVAVFIVKGGDAESLIAGCMEKNSDITDSLSSIERDVKRRGVGYIFNCREIARSLSEYGAALVYAVATSKTEGSVYSKSGGLTATPAGYAIIKDGKLADYLSPELSMGANLLMNKSGTGSLAIDDGQGGFATVYPETGKTKYSAIWDDEGNLRQLLVEVDVSGGLAELQRKLDLSDPEVIDGLSRTLSEMLKTRCRETLELSSTLGADFLGLLGFLRHKYPNEVKGIQEDFVAALRNAEIIVKVNAKLERSYDLDTPADSQGEGGKNA